MQHRAKFTAGPALVAAGLASVALIGCPQLLDDDFGITLREPEEKPGALDPDASVATAGAVGAGGPDADRYLPAAAGTQVVMVIDGVRGSITVYVDGSSVATRTGLTLDLAAIRDVNNWIGRSQFSEDPNFVGDVLDFRIYGSALSAAQVALSHGLGADAAL